MKTRTQLLPVLSALMILASCGQKNDEHQPAKSENTGHEIKTPDSALAEMKSGNLRFLNKKMINTDYWKQIRDNAKDQHPHTIVLSCMDSRVPPEIIFDQGIGSIFATRLAGNIEDSDILGSIEYAVAVKKIKLIVVMGHDSCGAIKGAIKGDTLGNLTQLLNHIRPAFTPANNPDPTATTKKNVQLTIDHILQSSPVTRERAVNKDSLRIVGAYYDINTGKVTFMDQ